MHACLYIVKSCNTTVVQAIYKSSLINLLCNSSMLPIIVGIIKFALGSLLDKGVNVVRNATADKLEDGDAMDEDWRAKIVNDLHDIKTKLDGLARKDLLASRCFLEEGIDLLLLVLGEMKDEETTEDEANGVQNVESTTTETTPTASTMTTATTTTTTTSATASTSNENKSVDVNEAIALVHAVQKLKNTSSNRFVSAKECFKAAREEATRAFCNEALKLTDRVMAAKLRVVCKILECLQDTKAAASGCMLFLKELNYLPGIGETFSTYFKYTFSTYFKSKFYKDSRLQDVKSVLSLNFAVSEFIARFSGELPDVRNWPRIHLSTKLETIHPLLLVSDVIREIFGDEQLQPPENHVTPEREDFRPRCINSKGELIALSGNKRDHACILKRSGELKTFCHLRQPTANRENEGRNVFALMMLAVHFGENEGRNVHALAVDFCDNVYLIMPFPFDGDDDKKTFVLFVFDSNGNEKSENVLDFIEVRHLFCITCVVNSDGDVIIHYKDSKYDNYFYVCDSNGNVKSRLSLEQSGLYSKLQCVTDKNEIIMLDQKAVDNYNVLVYTKEGKLKRTIHVKNRVDSVTYNWGTSQIQILVSKGWTTDSYCILSYSEKDDVEYLYLPSSRVLGLTLISHPAGPAAFVYYHTSEDISMITKMILRRYGFTRGVLGLVYHSQNPGIIFM